jgi:hypothetical protein
MTRVAMALAVPVLAVPPALPVGSPSGLAAAQGSSRVYDNLTYVRWSAADETDPGRTRLFDNSSVTIATDGTVTGTGSVTWGDEVWGEGSRQRWSGSGTLTMDGTFDNADGRLSGSFTMAWSYRFEEPPKAEGAVSWTGAWTVDYRGEFFSRPADGTTIIEFRGTEVMAGSSESSGGRVVPVDHRGDLTYRVDLGGRIPCFGGGDSGARFSVISGAVEVFPDADPEARRFAKFETVLNVCDHVVTGEDSLAVVAFTDMSIYRMGAEAEIVMAPPRTGPGPLAVLVGRILANAERVMEGKDIEVDTVDATIGVKGTTFVVDVSDTGTVVSTVEGEVEVTNWWTGASTVVGGGETVTVADGVPLAPEPFDAQAELAAWEAAFGPIDLGGGEADGSDDGTSSGDGGSSAPVVPIALGAAAVVALAVGGLGWRATRRRARPPDGR